MNNVAQIITEYTSADEERRLSLYLTHRHLRQAFIEIDLAEAPLRRMAAATPVKPRNRRWPKICLDWVRACGFAK